LNCIFRKFNTGQGATAKLLLPLTINSVIVLVGEVFHAFLQRIMPETKHMHLK